MYLIYNVNAIIRCILIFRTLYIQLLVYLYFTINDVVLVVNSVYFMVIFLRVLTMLYIDVVVAAAVLVTIA